MNKDNELLEVVKKSMGYTEQEAPKCENCKFATYPRGWEDGGLECRLNPALFFLIRPSARCNHFESKKAITS